MSYHHLVELENRLTVLHMEIEGLQLVHNFPNYFCQAQLNLYIISLGCLQHFFDKLIFDVLGSELIQKLCEYLKRLNPYIGFFIVQQLE